MHWWRWRIKLSNYPSIFVGAAKMDNAQPNVPKRIASLFITAMLQTKIRGQIRKQTAHYLPLWLCHNHSSLKRWASSSSLPLGRIFFFNWSDDNCETEAGDQESGFLRAFSWWCVQMNAIVSSVAEETITLLFSNPKLCRRGCIADWWCCW